jgi:hypothetical protein
VEGAADLDSRPAIVGSGIGNNLGTASIAALDLGIQGVGMNGPYEAVTLFSMDEMKTAAAYKGFDFDNVWMFRETDDFYYPALQNVDLVYTIKPVAVRITEQPS